MGESMMKSVKPVVSTRLNAPGDMEENIVSKISKLLSSPPKPVDIELSRQVLNNGSFKSNKVLFEVGVNVVNGAVEVEDGIVLNPFVKLRGDCPCVNDANVDANVSRIGEVF